MFFTVHVVNFENTALSLSGFVKDEDRAVIKKIDGFEGRIPANGEKNITFKHVVYGVGNHTFRVFLDDYDGIPNDEGEEHWSNASVEVKPVGDIIASMKCMDTVISYDGSTTCEVTSLNTGNNSVSVSIASVDFGTIHRTSGRSITLGQRVIREE